VFAEWKRGTRTIDTRVRRLGGEKNVARFGNIFEMKTKMNWDEF
jgi:hypothetical protein